MLGYAESLADLALGDVQHGVLRTGDLGAVDDEGFFTVVGRLKRFAKLFGRRVNLEDVERELESAFPLRAIATERRRRSPGLRRRRRCRPGSRRCRPSRAVPRGAPLGDRRSGELPRCRSRPPARRTTRRWRASGDEPGPRAAGAAAVWPSPGRKAGTPAADAADAHRAITPERCEPYRNVLHRVFGNADRRVDRALEDVPFLPVTLFKTHTLSSVPEAEVVKVLTSSGTTGQQPSRVFLDAETASVQSAVLVKVAQHFLGKDRLPMVILDHAGVVARSAQLLGEGRRHPGHGAVWPSSVLRAARGHESRRGWPSSLSRPGRGSACALVRLHLHGMAALRPGARASGAGFDLPGGILIHSGGWKKLQEAAVDARDVPRASAGGHRRRPGHQLLRHGRAGRRRLLREPAALPSRADLLRGDRARPRDARALAGRAARPGSGAELPAHQLPGSFACSPRIWA